MVIKNFFRIFPLILKNLYFLTFLNGFLFSTLLYFRMEASYERELFTAIQRSINKKIDFNDNEDSLVIKVMQSCNNLLFNRASVFTENIEDGLNDLKIDYLHPATIDLMTARGACGSYSLVLARILQNYHLPVRIAQMKARGRYGAHNIIEVELRSGWTVLDPTFNLYFTKPNEGLASFADVKSNWSYYSKQLPKGYDSSYRYADARYTNWQKIPVILPLAKKILDLSIGKERADGFCMRVYLLRMYDIYFYFTLLLFIPILMITLKRSIKIKLFPRYDIPLTVSNIYKYMRIRLGDILLKKSMNA